MLSSISGIPYARLPANHLRRPGYTLNVPRCSWTRRADTFSSVPAFPADCGGWALWHKMNWYWGRVPSDKKELQDGLGAPVCYQKSALVAFGPGTLEVVIHSLSVVRFTFLRSARTRLCLLCCHLFCARVREYAGKLHARDPGGRTSTVHASPWRERESTDAGWKVV